MGQNMRETGRRRARVAAVAIGTSSVLGAAALAAAVYTPSAVQTVSNTSGTSSGSEGDVQQYQQSQRHQQPQQGLQRSQGGHALGHSSGS